MHNGISKIIQELDPDYIRCRSCGTTIQLTRATILQHRQDPDKVVLCPKCLDKKLENPLTRNQLDMYLGFGIIKVRQVDEQRKRNGTA